MSALLRFLSRVFTRRVHCANCPRFRYIDTRPMPRQARATLGVIGACANDKVIMANFPAIRAAIPVRYPQDWCPAHPCYQPKKGDGLYYVPGDSHCKEAGFNRAPTLAEARALALDVDREVNTPNNSRSNTNKE